ncbi:MAG: hypothetical protein JNK48_03515 [Bryobacterales bacterium]|nr:hypothetical protein [Bryobacterales bacterium]
MNSTLRLLSCVAAGAMLLGAAANQCAPSYARLLDPKGNLLPMQTPFVASVEIAPKTAIVFRPLETDIRSLIERLRSEGETSKQLLTVAYWQDMRCRIVNNRCTGECPIKDGKKLRCLADRSGDPVPPPSDPTHKKKHGKNDGKPMFLMPQVSSQRCRCQ